MQSNIIREIIEMDKEARINEEKLELEKQRLNDFLKSEKKNIIEKYNNDVLKTIETTKNEVADDIQKKKEEALVEYNSVLENIEKNYSENKDKWIDSIFQYCIEDSKKGMI